MWLKPSKGKRQEGDRAGRAGPWGPQEALQFYPREVGTPGGLWVEEGGT